MHILSKKTVVVALSGGVDSSVAALLLKKKGFRVVGAFIRGYNVDGCQDRDAHDAAMVARSLSIPFYTFDFEEEYKKKVVDYLLEGYKEGITPNPDVVCNREIKFGLLYDRIHSLGASYIASGHYARISHWWGKDEIYQGKDKNKDQTYFLWDIRKETLPSLLFPVGGYRKERIRKIAQDHNLPTAQKKDSQGVCFLGQFNFREFLESHLGVKEGPVIDEQGVVIGTHQGTHLYTIGQRHGFTHDRPGPLYVVSKDDVLNTLYVAPFDHASTYTKKILLGRKNILDPKTEESLSQRKNISVYVKTRYRQPSLPATLVYDGDLSVTFSSPVQTFPAQGQSCVFYNSKEQLLGGAIIKDSHS